uniref:Ataxin-10 n=1 Tax=Nothoprocta perdicaria TaxID=30464 RepID=A0A8C6YYW2_NOTPE
SAWPELLSRCRSYHQVQQVVTCLEILVGLCHSLFLSFELVHALVYQLDGIPLILDNCSIDDNNPFVNQWAVFAIRNLTEQNQRNQELIAQLEERGLADNSVLESMGLQVEKQEDKLILRSGRKKP